MSNLRQTIEWHETPFPKDTPGLYFAWIEDEVYQGPLYTGPAKYKKRMVTYEVRGPTMSNTYMGVIEGHFDFDVLRSTSKILMWAKAPNYIYEEES